MAAEIRISTDPGRKLLRISVAGFLTPSDLSDYLPLKAKAMARLRCSPNEHVTLCDFTAATPQSREVLAFFKASLDDPASMSRRLAVVVVTALTRLQVQRIVTREGAACFSTIAEAQAWLFADEGDPSSSVADPPQPGTA